MSAAFHISGFAACSPETRLTNRELEARLETSDEWIVSRTGIRERRVLSEEETLSDLAVKAAGDALERTGLSTGDITHVVFTTCIPDFMVPSSACLLAGRLGLGQVTAFDLNAACSGFVYGLEMCRALLTACPEARILLVGADAVSRRANPNDRTTCVLFGDGAGASVLTAAPLSGPCAVIRDVECRADGSKHDLLRVGGGSRIPCRPGDPLGEDHFLSMNGREIFKYAVRHMSGVCRTLLERNGLDMADVDLFIPHQANLRIIEAVGERLHVPADKVFVNVDLHGNTSAASIPLALDEALSQGVIRPGMTVLLATFGGGLTWGGALLQFRNR